MAMDFPDRDAALAWVGRTLIDRDGAKIGACTAVFSDDATGLTEWVCSELDGAAVFIPAVGAAESGDQVRVTVSRTEVSAAPSVGGDRRISEDEEAVLYRHYGIPHSRDASPTLLPTETPPTQEEMPTETPPTEEMSTEDALPGPAGTAATRPVAAPAVADDAVAPAAGPDAAREPAQPTEGRRWAVPVASGLAAAGAVAGTALAVRRRRARRRLTRAERIALGARAMAAAVSSRTGRVAGPLVNTTERVVRRPRRAAAAGGLPTAVALALAAVRRRRSGSSRPSRPSRAAVRQNGDTGRR
ncbi:MAG TPA: hypothetical protein VE547_20160 [Mycobacteriales bacterium]|nr:hypothetical protein [Mycobacteriales bacterium]